MACEQEAHEFELAADAERLQADFTVQAVQTFLGGYRDADAQFGMLTPEKVEAFKKATGLQKYDLFRPAGQKVVVGHSRLDGLIYLHLDTQKVEAIHREAH